MSRLGSPYVFNESDKARLVETVIALGDGCGEEIAPSEIEFIMLGSDTGHSALKLSTTSDDTTYVEYPLTYGYQYGMNAGDVSPRIHADIIRYLLRRRWTAMRDICISLDTDFRNHEDVTINTLWCAAIVEGHPDRQHGIKAAKGEYSLSAKVGSKDNQTFVSDDGILIPHRLPEVVTSRGLVRLGDVLEMPSCGDEDVQHKFEDQYIFGFEDRTKGTLLSTSVSRVPFADGAHVYPWRIVRRRDYDTYPSFILGTDPLRYDRDGDIARHRQFVDEFLIANGTPEDFYAGIKKKAA